MNYLTAKVVAIQISARGRFVLLEMESLPKDGLVLRRIHFPSESLRLSDRVKILVDPIVKIAAVQL